MDTMRVSSVLLLCGGANYALLLVSFLAFVLFRQPMYRLHRRWFALSDAELDAVCYQLFGAGKLAIWFVFLVPGLVLRFLA